MGFDSKKRDGSLDKVFNSQIEADAGRRKAAREKPETYPGSLQEVLGTQNKVQDTEDTEDTDPNTDGL